MNQPWIYTCSPSRSPSGSSLNPCRVRRPVALRRRSPLPLPLPAGLATQVLMPGYPHSKVTLLMLNLTLQYFGHLMRRANSLEKTPILGNIEGRRRRGGQKMKWLDGLTDSMDMSLHKFQEMVKDKKVWRAAVRGAARSVARLNK